MLTAGDTMRCIDISSVQDDVLEADETLVLQLSSVDSAVLLGTVTTTITITNDDSESSTPLPSLLAF